MDLSYNDFQDFKNMCQYSCRNQMLEPMLYGTVTDELLTRRYIREWDG